MGWFKKIASRAGEFVGGTVAVVAATPVYLLGEKEAAEEIIDTGVKIGAGAGTFAGSAVEDSVDAIREVGADVGDALGRTAGATTRIAGDEVSRSLQAVGDNDGAEFAAGFSKEIADDVETYAPYVGSKVAVTVAAKATGGVAAVGEVLDAAEVITEGLGAAADSTEGLSDLADSSAAQPSVLDSTVQAANSDVLPGSSSTELPGADALDAPSEDFLDPEMARRYVDDITRLSTHPFVEHLATVDQCPEPEGRLSIAHIHCESADWGDESIHYDAETLEDIRRDKGEDAVFGIFAHEVGHSVEGVEHPWPYDKRDELNADWYAGYMLAKADRSPEPFIDWLREYAEEGGRHSGPAAREAAVREGFRMVSREKAFPEFVERVLS